MAAELVVETLADAGVAREAVIGAGMGLPGPIDQGDGTVGSSAILPGWIGMTAAAELQQAARRPGDGRQRRQPRRAGRGRVRRRPRRRRPDLPEGLVRASAPG